MFSIVFITNILINVDHGVLPACYEKIEKKIGINDFYFGMLGSVVYGGFVIGSAAAAAIYSVGSRIKPCLIITLVLNMMSLIAFTQSYSFFGMVTLRGFTGIF